MDVLKHNRNAWDRQVLLGNRWTQPVSAVEIAHARVGDLRIFLTPMRPVPFDWIGPVKGKKILCLASGGGQQGPLLAAAGAYVAVLDASEMQLERDRTIAEKEALLIETVLGDMANLNAFQDSMFDLIVHPVSNCFVPDVLSVWRECFRVLKHGGSLLSGFANPIVYSFDRVLSEKGVLQLKYSVPYSDPVVLSSDELRRLAENGEPIEFGHSLEDQIGGQLKSGFLLRDFYEDKCGEGRVEDRYFPSFIATLALKA